MQVVEAGRWTDEDALVRDAIAASGKPALLVVNKVDAVKDKASLLPFVDAVGREHAPGRRCCWCRQAPRRSAGGGARDRAPAPGEARSHAADELTGPQRTIPAAELVRE